MALNVAGIGWLTAASKGRGRDLNRFSITDGKLPDLTANDLRPAVYKRFGRLDAFSKLGLVALSMTLSDAGITSFETGQSIGIIANTRYGCLSTDVAYYRSVSNTETPGGSPHLFAYTLPSSFLGDAAICFNFTGPCFTLDGSAAAGLFGLVMAHDMIILGQAEKMLVGTCDLAWPPELAPRKGRKPHAFFFLLVKENQAKPSYGTLEIKKDSTCRLDSRKIADLFDLTRVCFARSKSTVEGKNSTNRV